MKYIITILALLATNYVTAEGKKPAPEKPQLNKPAKPKVFPKHWGKPPEIQTKDIMKLPAGFGMGSSTLANWIKENLKKDHENKRPSVKPKPLPPVQSKPKPTKPTRPSKDRVQPPQEVKDKMETYKNAQKNLQEELKERLKGLGNNPSREEVKKEVDAYRLENKDLIDSQKRLSRDIHDWHRQNLPERPRRPEPSEEVKERLEKVREQEKAFMEVRKAFHEAMKNSKEMSKEERDKLIKEFKDASSHNHKLIKEAQKALQEEVRKTKQTEGRRR